MNYGKSIKLYLVDGTPNGIITAEIMNWSGHVIAAPRSRLADLLQRPEVSRTGLYILTGDDPDELERKLAYIGETESIDERLAQHNKTESAGGKDFWDRVVIITSKDANLTKGHLRFLESRLITIAQTAGRVKLTNTKGKKTEYGVLPEADMADMQFFSEQIRLVLPVLGLDLFREVPKVSASVSSMAQSPLFELAAPKLGITALAKEIDGEFIVLTGSQARAEWGNQQHNGYQALHQRLIVEQRVEVDSPGLLRFISDYPFTSPSAASAVILGRNDNGRTSWRVKESGQTYAAWQEAQLEISLC